METVKSFPSSLKVGATFRNTSQRLVDLYWVDFSGGYVLYAKKLAPGRETSISTFVTHVWVAFDTVTGQRLRLAGKSVFVTPLPLDSTIDEEASLEFQGLIFAGSMDIAIHIPVFTLEEICIGYFRKHLSAQNLNKLEVNRYLSEKLSNIPQIAARIYRPLSGITDD